MENYLKDGKVGVMRQIEYKQETIQEIKRILLKHSDIFIDINFSTEIEDTKFATDFVVRILNKDISVRIRKSDCEFRDFTIRAMTKYGGKTEIHKIKEGYGDIYLYSWQNENREIREYIIVDINKLRNSGLLNDRKTIPNIDGTGFISIEIDELEEEDCLLVKDYQRRI